MPIIEFTLLVLERGGWKIGLGVLFLGRSVNFKDFFFVASTLGLQGAFEVYLFLLKNLL